jgi:hypothetical protein
VMLVIVQAQVQLLEGEEEEGEGGEEEEGG